jgi:hypothetical protein
MTLPDGADEVQSMPPVRQIRDLPDQGHQAGLTPHQIREKPLVGIGLRRSRSGTQRLYALTGITYTATLDVGRETPETLAQFLREHRERLGTRKGTRSLGVGWPNSPATGFR